MKFYSRALLIFGLSVATISIAYSKGAAADQGQIEKGKEKYSSFCIYCHGADGAGTGPASGLSGVPTGDLSNKAYMSLLSDDEITDRVAYGEEKYPYLQMPGWRSSLDPEMIKAVVAYVRTLAVDQGPLKGLSPQERMDLFTRDPLERGRIYYLRYCSACHGKSGDGKGWLAEKALKKPIALGSPEINAALTYDKIKNYVTNVDRWDKSYMPVFDEEAILDKLKEIFSHIKTLPSKFPSK